MSGRAKRIRARKSSQVRNRIARSESLEPRTMMSGNGLGAGFMLASTPSPTVSHAITINGGQPINGKTATLSVLGSDAAGASTLVYDWTVNTVPIGASATFSANGTNGAENTLMTFTKAGTYVVTAKIVDAKGLSVTSSATITVNATLTSVKIITSNGIATNATSPLQVTGVNQGLVAQGFDQFGNALATQPIFHWSNTTVPSGAPTPGLSASGANATFTYGKVGSYVESVQATAGGVSVSGSAAIVVVAKPTYFVVSQVSGSSSITGTSAQFTGQIQDQFHNVVSAASNVTWASTSRPSGAAAPTFSTSGTTTTVTFKAAGQYTLTATETDSSGNSISQPITVTVLQTPTSVVQQSNLTTTVSGTTAKVNVPTFLDQFGNVLATQPAITWAATLPSGAAAPTITTSAGVATFTFTSAGAYTLTAKVTGEPNVTFVSNVTVTATLTSIVVTPGTASVSTGATQQFTAQAYDQFNHLMQTQPTFAWSSNGGTITTGGLFTAPGAAGSFTITAKSGSLTGTTAVSVQASSSNTLNLQNSYLSTLVQTLDAGGSISRSGMIQILDAVAANGTITASELSDLKTIVADASKLNIAGYVTQLASDVVNGNTANATYLGKSLGNLAVGSSAVQLTDLVGKWFLGTDLPTLTDSSYVYKTVAGSLFPTSPSIANEFQGELGDCYFISSLGTIADQDPQAIKDMIINNGDGTYTVRFYTGTYGYTYNPSDGSYSDGFANGTGTPEYVTVNSQLPTTASGMLIYADYGASYSNAANSLWIPLLEKAYAEWNQTGAEGRDGTNSYNGIQGGWMATVDAQVLGHNATDYFMGTATEQQLINALSSGKAVTIGTINDEYGLYGSHAYAVTAYNASTNTFTLYNPWGFDQPGQLTWSELASDCSGFVATDASNPSVISSGAVKSGIVSAIASETPGTVTVATSAGPTSARAVDLLFASGGNFSAADDAAHHQLQWSSAGGNSANVVSAGSSAGTTSSQSAGDLAFGDNWSLESGTVSQLSR